MSELADFVGLPFADHGRGDGVDCWGLARAALKACAGIDLPDYGSGYASVTDRVGVAQSIRDGLADGWVRVERPRMYDLAIFNIAGRPGHVGLMVGPTMFLHAPEPDDDGNGGTSRVESVNSPMWAKRLEGFYRHV